MSPPIFAPSPRNLGWSVKKTPMNSTTVATHRSGREVRVQNWASPLYQFELTFTGLAGSAQYPGLGGSSLQQLMGLFNQVAGQAGTFLFTDPTDGYAKGQPLGVADGVTTVYPFVRALNNAPAEPVGYVTFVQQVHVGGVQKFSNWFLTNPTQTVPYPALNFYNPQPAGQQITCDFNFAFVCRFNDDSIEFEQMMKDLWQAQTVKFRSVRGGGF